MLPHYFKVINENLLQWIRKLSYIITSCYAISFNLFIIVFFVMLLPMLYSYCLPVALTYQAIHCIYQYIYQTTPYIYQTTPMLICSWEVKNTYSTWLGRNRILTEGDTYTLYKVMSHINTMVVSGLSCRNEASITKKKSLSSLQKLLSQTREGECFHQTFMTGKPACFASIQ